MKSRLPKNNSEEEYNPYLRETIMQIVDNQINNSDPPETKETLDRLVGLGYTEQAAKEKIAVVVIGYIYDAMKYQKECDNDKYIADLKALK